MADICRKDNLFDENRKNADRLKMRPREEDTRITIGSPERSLKIAEIIQQSQQMALLESRLLDFANKLKINGVGSTINKMDSEFKPSNISGTIVNIIDQWFEQKGDNPDIIELKNALNDVGCDKISENLGQLDNQIELSADFCAATLKANQEMDFTKMVDVGTKISYFPDKILGAGSNGSTVYEGRYKKEKSVVVKRLHDGFEKYVKEEINLLKEAGGHQNVIECYGHEFKNGFYYAAWELCQATLEDWATNNEKGREFQSIKDLDILSQCVDGLTFIHEKKIVHRNLRPSNILLLKQSKNTINVKISDFGLSKLITNESYTFSGPYGSIGWMAPEVLGGKKGDEIMGFKTDIFSLGCLFYYVLSKGGHPFGDEARAIRRQINIRAQNVTMKPDIPYKSRSVTHLVKSMINFSPIKRPPISVVKCHPLFWDTPTVFKFFAHIKAVRNDSRVIVEDAFHILEKLGKENNILEGEDWMEAVQRGIERFGRNFDVKYYRKDTGGLICVIKNYSEFHRNVECVNDWLELFPKLLTCAWIAFKNLADKDDERFREFYEDTENPFWKTDACSELI